MPQCGGQEQFYLLRFISYISKQAKAFGVKVVIHNLNGSTRREINISENTSARSQSHRISFLFSVRLFHLVKSSSEPSRWKARRLILYASAIKVCRLEACNHVHQYLICLTAKYIWILIMKHFLITMKRHLASPYCQHGQKCRRRHWVVTFLTLHLKKRGSSIKLLGFRVGRL